MYPINLPNEYPTSAAGASGLTVGLPKAKLILLGVQFIGLAISKDLLYPPVLSYFLGLPFATPWLIYC